MTSDSRIPPGTARVFLSDCPICKKTGIVETRIWVGEWVSVGQGEALTNLHFYVATRCGCSLSSDQQISAYYGAMEELR